MTVRELLATMTSAEMTEWQAFAAIEPFGDRRADIQTGIIAATLVNLHKSSDPISPLAFVPDYWRTRTPAETEEEQVEADIEMLKRLTLRMGGRVIKRSELENG